MTTYSLVRKFLLCSFLCAFAFNMKAAVIYVDSAAVSGANNGTSWTDAYLRLSSGLTSASAGDTIWVAKGTYYPGLPGQPLVAFAAKSNVGVLGGFSGLLGAQETASSQRNHILNKTILSGDLDKSGTFSLDDSYHVITCSAIDTSAYFEGFTITGGNATSSGINRLGGAIFGSNGGLKLKYCNIERNHANVNGGAGSITGGHIFESCIFKDNDAVQGGAIAQQSSVGYLRIRNTVFVDNFASQLGGGIFALSPDFKVENCTFLGNSSPAGACIRPLSNAAMEVTNSIFWGNTGPAFSGTIVTVNKCIVEGGYPSGTNILDVDPNFSDSLGRIFACSPAVDAGDTLSHIISDLDANARPFDGNNSGTAKWDMGAFEVSVAQAFPAVNPIVGDISPCLNSLGSIYHVTNDNSASNSYDWALSAGGTIVGSTTNDSVGIDWGNALGSYLLTVEEKDLVTGCATSDSLTIVPDSLPVVTLNPAGNDSICLGDSLLITGNGSGSSRQWLLNGGSVAGQTSNQVQASQAGFWNMSLTDGNGCTDTASTSLELYLRPLPVVNLTTSASPEICFNDSVTITGTAGQSHQWFQNGSAIGGATANS